MKHKAGDYGKTWWNCDYCKLSHTIRMKPLPCQTCDKHNLDGATPETKAKKKEPYRRHNLSGSSAESYRSMRAFRRRRNPKPSEFI